MAKVSKSAIPNWKKKKWYKIISPSIYSEKVVGECFAESPDLLIGRTLYLNMMNVVGGKQNFSLKLRVVDVKDNSGYTKPILLKMAHSSIRRLIRSGRERVDLSLGLNTKDGIKVRIKPLIVTRGSTNISTLKDIRAKTTEFLNDYVAKNNYEYLFDSVTKASLQKELKNILDKIYPLKMIEIRHLEVETTEGKRNLEIVKSPAKKEEDKSEE